MNAVRGADPMAHRKMILSTLWIFAVLNYIYADVFTLMFNPSLQPDVARDLEAGRVGDMQVTQGFALTFAVLMQTALIMVLLSRMLRHTPNRWANIAAGAFHTALVAWSLTGGSQNYFYVFFATIEIACTLFIVWYAWTWRDRATRPIDTPTEQSAQNVAS